MPGPHPVKETFFLFANVNVVPDRYDEWQAAFDKLSPHVYKEEPNTLTYYFGIPLEHADNPSRTDYMFAFEAYKAREDLYDTHLKSEPMTKDFLPAALESMTTGLDLCHYDAVGGFLDSSGNKTECGIMQDVRIQCVDEATRKTVLGELAKLCEEVEGKQKPGQEGNEVLTFLGCRSLDGETGVRIFSRYKSRAVMEDWLRTDLMKGFWVRVKEGVASMEAHAFAPNGKAWLWK